MKTYAVELTGTYWGHINAESEQEAREKALQNIQEQDGIMIDMMQYMNVELGELEEVDEE